MILTCIWISNGLINCIGGVMVIVGLSADKVKPKNWYLLHFRKARSMLFQWANTIKKNPTKLKWSSTKRTSSSTHWRLTSCPHDIAEKLLSWRLFIIILYKNLKMHYGGLSFPQSYVWVICLFDDRYTNVCQGSDQTFRSVTWRLKRCWLVLKYLH